MESTAKHRQEKSEILIRRKKKYRANMQQMPRILTILGPTLGAEQVREIVEMKSIQIDGNDIEKMCNIISTDTKL